MKENVIEISGLSKSYKIQEMNLKSSRSLRAEINKKAKRLLYKVGPFGSPPLEDKIHWALKDISFDVKKGEKLAITGNNGSGKTTLLKILSRITTPTSGSVKIKGKLSCLLQAGTGFHPELTGRENIMMNGIILGISKKVIEQNFEEIVEFSGVRDFLDVPIKFYSTGMQSRLGFSVASHLKSDIMLIDEGLASGDSEFRSKAIKKIKELSDNDRTIIFVSHDEEIVNNICSRIINLDKGVMISDTLR